MRGWAQDFGGALGVWGLGWHGPGCMAQGGIHPGGRGGADPPAESFLREVVPGDLGEGSNSQDVVFEMGVPRTSLEHIPQNMFEKGPKPDLPPAAQGVGSAQYVVQFVRKRCKTSPPNIWGG